MLDKFQQYYVSPISKLQRNVHSEQDLEMWLVINFAEKEWSRRDFHLRAFQDMPAAISYLHWTAKEC